MISRVAEHCFWMTRYLERAENTARLLEVNQTLLLDFHVPVEQQWQPVLIISGIHDFKGDGDAETVQRYMTWDDDNLCSIASSVRAARENARIVRETISAEMWERVNAAYLWFQSGKAENLYTQNRQEFYAQIKRGNQTFNGIADGTMSHDEAWEFLQLGRYLERASQTARVLDVKYHVLLPTLAQVGTPVDNAHWVAILKSCSGYEPYHKVRHAGEPNIAIPGFLIFDPHFPRSVRRCLQECQNAAHNISGRPFSQPNNEVERTLHDLLAWLQLAQIEDFVRTGLHEALTDIINRIQEIGSAIHSTYFDVQPDRPLDYSI